MKLTKTLVAVLTMLATTMAVHASDKQVSFTVLRNYFHNSNAPALSSPLITNKQAFDEQFGMAAFMGKGGQPTPVNFGKSAVLAIVLSETNKAIDIDSVMVTETGKKELTLAYTVHEGAEQSFYVRPLQLMAIDKRYKSYQVKVVPTVCREVSTSTSSFDTYFYKDSRHGMSFCNGATFDKQTGKQVTLIQGDATLQKMLTERLKKASGVEHFSEEPVPMPKAAPYVVAGGKIKFIYQPYEIGAYAIGRPECEFYPYELDKWLTKDGKGLMNR